jgi:hypothetical protein
VFRDTVGDEGQANGGTEVLDYRVSMATVTTCPEGALYVNDCLGVLGDSAVFETIVEYLQPTEFTIYSL